MTPRELSIELRRIASKLENSGLPSMGLVFRDIRNVVNKVAAQDQQEMDLDQSGYAPEDYRSATVTLQVSPNGDRSGLTITRSDGVTLSGEMYEGGVYEVQSISTSGLGERHESELLRLLHDWMM